jgi:alanine racemase
LNKQVFYSAWAEIDLQVIEQNIKNIQKFINCKNKLSCKSKLLNNVKTNSKPKILGVVKANAYGHGLMQVANSMIRAGVQYLGTAQVSEALVLRQNGISSKDAKILAWLYTPDAPFDEIIASDIELSVGSIWALEKIAYTVKNNPNLPQKAKIHLKMDIEFGRDGFSADLYDECFKKVKEYQKYLKVTGLWTHFAMADIPEHPSNKRVLQAYNLFVDKYIEYFGQEDLPIRHIANSAICLTHPELAFDMIRPGILAYGLKTIDTIDIKKMGFYPAMRLFGKFSSISKYPRGAGVSYGHKYKPKENTNIAVIPLGYADGLRWVNQNKIQCYSYARKNLIKSVGSVCMDQILFDLGQNCPEKPGDKVEFFGRGEKPNSLTADDLAKMVGTIGYNVITSIAAKVPRIYKNEIYKNEKYSKNK